MANIKQQKKRILVAERQRVENIRYRSSIKTAFRRLVEAVQSGDAKAVEAAHQHYVSLVDRAAAKRALHAKTAARKKSRATRVIARGPQVEETKKRRVTRKTAAKAPKAAEAVVEEAAAEVAEAPADDAPAEEAVEAPVEDAPRKKAPAKKPAAKKTAEAEADEAPAAEADVPADEAPAEEPAAEADAPADES
ncbi:MAG: 30S ribosomal protein S20 [Gaiellales bacterium]